MMYCYNCKKDKDTSAFTKAKACDTCYDKTKAYYEANKERRLAQSRAAAAIRNEENRVKREEARRIQDEEKARIRAEEEARALAAKVCPYEQLKKDGIDTKQCSVCKCSKPLEAFRIVTKLGVDKIAPKCTVCYIRQKTHYEQNKATILAKNKEYKIKNAAHIKEHRRDYLKKTHEYVRQREKAYWEKNREHMNAKIAEYQRTNLHVRMKARISARIRENIKKLKSTKEYLGCGGDMDVLLQWLEHQFDENINWDNYGSYWQLDHVLPVKKFNMKDEDEVHVCFAWMNIQPLERIANTTKSNKILPNMVDAHIKKLQDYAIQVNCEEEMTSYLHKYITLYNKFKAL